MARSNDSEAELLRAGVGKYADVGCIYLDDAAPRPPPHGRKPHSVIAASKTGLFFLDDDLI